MGRKNKRSTENNARSKETTENNAGSKDSDAKSDENKKKNEPSNVKSKSNKSRSAKNKSNKPGIANKKSNVRMVNKWHGYYMEDMECIYCPHYAGKRKSCKREKCCCEDEKLDAIAKGRIKRKRGSMAWRG